MKTKVRVVHTVHVTGSGTRTRYSGLGRKGEAVARVYLVPGDGNITVNGKTFETYFGLGTWKEMIMQPLITTGTDKKYDVKAYVHGAGLSNQAGAIRIGIMRAVIKSQVGTVTVPRVRGCSTKAALKKEQKKYGLRAGRKAPQLSKR